MHRLQKMAPARSKYVQFLGNKRLALSVVVQNAVMAIIVAMAAGFSNQECCSESYIITQLYFAYNEITCFVFMAKKSPKYPIQSSAFLPYADTKVSLLFISALQQVE